MNKLKNYPPPDPSMLYNYGMLSSQNIVPTKFIILHTLNTGEADKVVYGISQKHGFVEVLAKGSRKPKAKFQNLLETGYLSEIKYVKSHKNILTEVIPFNPVWTNLFGSIRGLSILNYLCETSIHVAKQQHDNELSNEELFTFISGYLANISLELDSPFNTLLDFDMSVMQIMGYRPHFEVCYEHGYAYLAGFNVEEGNYLCGRCDDIYNIEHNIAITQDEAFLLNKLLKHHLDVVIDKDTFLQLHSILISYIEFHGYFRIKSNTLLYDAYDIGGF